MTKIILIYSMTSLAYHLRHNHIMKNSVY